MIQAIERHWSRNSCGLCAWVLIRAIEGGTFVSHESPRGFRGALPVTAAGLFCSEEGERRCKLLSLFLGVTREPVIPLD